MTRILDSSLISVCLLGLCLLLVASSVEARSEAGSYYKSGVEAFETERYEEAVGLFERAVRLAPQKSRYARKLAQAKEAAAGQLIHRALEQKHLREQVELFERAEEYSRSHPAVVRFRQNLNAALDELRTQVVRARTLLEKGVRSPAKEILSTYAGVEELLPALNELRLAASVSVAKQRAVSAIEKQDYSAAEQVIRQYEPRLDGGDFEELRREVFAAISPDLMEIDRLVQTQSGGLAAQHRGLLPLAQLSCDEKDCVQVDQLQADLAQDVRQSLAPYLEKQPADDDPVARYARCFLIARAEAHLEEITQFETPQSQCPAGAAPAPLRVALDVNGRPGCESIASTFQQSLRMTDALEDLGLPIALTGGPEAEVEVRIDFQACGASVVEQKDIRTKSSTQRAGTQQVANPEYAIAQSKLHAAQADLAAFPNSCICIGPCSQYALTLCRSVKQGAVIGARRRLNSVRPFLERPIDVPYTYQQFQTGSVAEIASTVVLKRPEADAVLASDRLVSKASRFKTATRGVSPTDVNGLDEKEPTAPPPEQMMDEATATFKAQFAEFLKAELPKWFAVKAAAELEAGHKLTALGYVARLESAKSLPHGPLEQALAIGKNSGFLRPDLVLVAVPTAEGLETASPRVTTAAHSPEQGMGETAGVLDQVVRAVVSIDSSHGSGSGFFISPAGLIVTNEHVVGDDQTVEVTTHSGDVFLGRLLERSSTSDLALLQVDASEMPFLHLGDSRSVRLGASVWAVGNPHGLSHSVSRGIVSAFRTVQYLRLVQTDAAINPGNSGGPLVLEDGTAIGVNTLKIIESEGLNFAIGTEAVKQTFASRLGGS